MKRILLTSTALVVMAGAAAAEFEWTGSVDLGYNDEYEGGVFVDADIDLTFTQELDNGITASLSYGFELEDIGDGGGRGQGDRNPDAFSDDNLLIQLESDAGRLAYGDLNDIEPAAKSYHIGVTNDDDVNDHSEYDGETALRADLYLGAFSMGVSTAFDTVDRVDGDSDDDDARQLTVGAKYEGANFAVAITHQEQEDPGFGESGDFDQEELTSVGASFTVASVDLTAAYIDGDNGSSYGVQAEVPFGDFTGTAFYVVNDADDDAEVSDVDDNLGVELGYDNGTIGATAWFHDGYDAEYGLEASYALAGGLTFYAGYILGDDATNDEPDEDFSEAYVAATYDMGSGAELLVSYGEAGDGITNRDDLDEIGDAFEVREGTTIQLSLDF